MEYIYQINGGDFVNAGKAASEVKGILKQLDVPPQRIRRVVVALYEAEINVVAHAYSGNIKAFINPEWISLTISDRGPGIKDLGLAMKEGYSTASKEVREMGFGAGMGLPNIRKNSDELNINSTLGEGTTVHIKNLLRE